jgi:hypothetical protein
MDRTMYLLKQLLIGSHNQRRPANRAKSTIRQWRPIDIRQNCAGFGRDESGGRIVKYFSPFRFHVPINVAAGDSTNFQCRTSQIKKRSRLVCQWRSHRSLGRNSENRIPQASGTTGCDELII